MLNQKNNVMKLTPELRELSVAYRERVGQALTQSTKNPKPGETIKEQCARLGRRDGLLQALEILNKLEGEIPL